LKLLWGNDHINRHFYQWRTGYKVIEGIMSDLHSVFLTLKELVKSNAPHMKVSKDTIAETMFIVPQDVMAAKDPVWFSTVKLTPNGVAVHLPVLVLKEARGIDVPDALKERAQTKTCFHFVTTDPERFAHLSELLTRLDSVFAPQAKGRVA